MGTVQNITTNYLTSSTLSANTPQSTDLGAFFQVKQPIGTILMYGGSSLPANYLWCDGSAYYNSQYLNLVNVIGYTYGGDGSSIFNVPDLRNRMPIGGQVGGSSAVNYQGGTPINSGNSYIATNQIQIPQHVHTAPQGVGFVVWNNMDYGTNVPAGNNGLNINVSSSGNETTAYNEASPSPQQFLPPFCGVSFIIKFN